MASPQIENGYTKIANELLDAICCIDLSSHEWKVLHAIIRKTYGYNKKEDWMTNTQIMLLTGQSQQKVSQAKRRLVNRKIVTENGNKISINKDYEQWQIVTENGNSVTENGNKSYRKRLTQKKKDNIQNKLTETDVSEELKDNQKDMGWNKFGDEPQEATIDYDTGEKVADELEAEKAEVKGLNAKIRHNLKLVEEARGLPFGKGRDMNAHVKMYRELLDNGWSHQALIEEFLELTNSDYWKEQKKMGQYPGVNTLQFTLRNKKPV